MPRDPKYVYNADQRAAQDTHLARLKGLERFPVAFRNPDHLGSLALSTPILDLLTRAGSVHRPVSLPYPSLGTLFKGRDEFLQRLRDSLRHTGDGRATAIAGQALHGLGGVGKTRLAVEYAWRSRDDYTAVLFVTADSPEALRANLAGLAGPLVLNLPEHDAPEEEAQVAAALRWLRDHPGWFLILDNVDTEEAAEAVEELVTRLHGGQVLITGRLAQWGGWVEPMDLDVLAPTPAAEFLLQRTSRRRKSATDEADAAALARELDGLALALEQAGAYVNARRISLAEYLRLWRSHEPTVQEWHVERLMKYPRSVAVTWQTTMDRLGPAETSLLRILSWLAPDPLPLWVLESEEAEAIWQNGVDLTQARAGDGSQTLAETSATGTSPSPTAWAGRPMGGGGGTPGRGLPRDAVLRLADYGMVRHDANAVTVSVHRVVQEIVRSRLPEARQSAWLTLSLGVLNAAAPGDPGDVRAWPHWEPLRPHVAAVAAHGEAAEIPEPTSRLLNQLGRLLDAKALHAEAEPLYRRALAIDETSFGPDHPEVATDLNNLAHLLFAAERPKDAETHMRRALIIRTRFGLVTGHEHPHLQSTQRSYTAILQVLGRTDAEIQTAFSEVAFEAGAG